MTTKVSKAQRVDAAVERINVFLDCGHLLALTDQAAWCEAVADRLEAALAVAPKEQADALTAVDQGQADYTVRLTGRWATHEMVAAAKAELIDHEVLSDAIVRDALDAALATRTEQAMSVGPKEMRRIRDDFECDGQVDYDQTAALIAALDEANAKLKELEYANEMRRQVIAVIEPRLESAEAKLEQVREVIQNDAGSFEQQLDDIQAILEP